MKYTNVNYKESNKERDERFKRSTFVMQEIANNAEPTSKNISYALGLKEGVVTDKVVKICEGIVINSITLPLPNYNSANSELFRSVVGSSSSTGNRNRNRNRNRNKVPPTSFTGSNKGYIYRTK
jgi:hypothetical protein